MNRQREQTRKRMQRLRAQRKEGDSASVPPISEQLQLGERIVNLGSIEEENAPHTLAQVGLRVQNMTLAQDASNAQLQEEAQEVDEHDGLYTDSAPSHHPNMDSRRTAAKDFFRRFTVPKNRSAKSEHEPAPQSSSGLSRFFPTLPPTNPFAARNVTLPADNDPNVTSADDGNAYVLPSPPDNETGPEDNVTVVASNQGLIEDLGAIIQGSEDQLVDSSAEETVEEGSDDDNNINGVHDSADSAESFHDFASEHSAPDEENHDQHELPAHEYMIEKLYEQLVLGFHGCSEDQHAETLREHIEEAGDNHYSLSEVFNDPDFPSVLGQSEMMSADRLSRQENPSSSQWSSMFCGVSRRRRTPMNVCLHKEQTQAVASDVAYDIDSFVGFGSSLGMARKGLWVQPVSQMRQNMTADVHIETTVFHISEDIEQPMRSSSAMLRDVPHFLLGRVVGAHDITIHILFPHMAFAGEKFVSLTKEQMTRWLDIVFLLALHSFYDPHYTQHLPASFRHAFANSKAHQVEGRQVETASYRAQQSIGYHLQPEYLDAMWSTMMETIANTPGLADFRQPELFFGAKGTKLQFKTSPLGSRTTLLNAMEHFETFFEDLFDPAFVQLDRFYVDVGKEICPRVSLLALQQAHVGDEPQVYLPRRCCQEEYMRWMYDGQPPRKGKGWQHFYTNMLYDASSLTSVTPKRSKQREGGLIYSQFYASVKELSDATKCFPFNNDGMEEMALDPQIRKGARQAAGGQRRNAAIIEHAYLASKRRTRDALTDSIKKSFGIREEHRIKWELFRGLQVRLQHEASPISEIEFDDCPSHAWPVKTSVYLNYLWRSGDKFATGFEVVRARCRNDFVTWEQTKMMAMFLRCLRFIFGGHLLSRESALWWSRRERTVGEPARLRIWYGLGFCNTLQRYGYCWLEPRVDWSLLQFKSEVTDQILFGNNVLRGQYLRRGGQVQAFFDTTRRMELALGWMERHSTIEAIRDRMILWLVHICLQQFRVDVLGCVKAEIVNEHREGAMEGKTPFCFEWLDEIMTNGVYPMSGNRCDFKIVSHLGEFLFEFDDGRIRDHWEDRPYRKLYRRAVVGVRSQGREVRRSFLQEFWRALYQYHWILPYPCGNALMQTTKQGKRMWYSIKTRAGVEAREAETKDWAWARKSWMVGRPRRLPRWLSWSKEEWERWIEEHQGVGM